jgi:hypothetical protein
VRDVAPAIDRQRALIEGTAPAAVPVEELHHFLLGLTDAIGTRVAAGPLGPRRTRDTVAASVEWPDGWARVTVWADPTRLVSVDVARHGPLDLDALTEYTRTAFGLSEVAAEHAGADAPDRVIDLREAPTPEPTTAGPDLWAPEYLSAEFAADAIRSLRAQFGGPEQDFGVYYVDGLDPRSSLGRMVELERFNDQFENDADELRDLYGGFEQAGKTEIIVVVDHVGLRPAGVIRTVRHSREYGCRILNDLCADGEDGWGLSMEDVLWSSQFAARRPEDVLDIPTIAVSGAYSGGSRVDSVSKALCAGLFRRSLAGDTQTWVCSLDRVPYILIQQYTADVFSEFDGVPPRPYYGSPDTVPLWSNFRDHELRLIAEFPELHERYALGAGLEDYFLAPPEHAAAFAPVAVD